MKELQILVVDDDIDFARSLGNLLGLDGHQVVIASSGEEALDLYKNQDFDITFMDIRLPGMNGVESFLELQKLKPSAQVLMMTAYSAEELIKQAVDNGAVGILSKPFDISDIRKILKSTRPAGIVLVADDDTDVVKSLKHFLSSYGYCVLVAHTGEHAVETILETDVDVLILDLKLPILSGLEVYLKIKEHNRSVPTIIITGYTKEESDSLDQLQILQCNGYLEKPVNPKLLLQLVAELADLTESESPLS